MGDTLGIEWPWEMVDMDDIDSVIAAIKERIPPGHELQSHTFFPGIKWDGRLIFIVDDDTTGEFYLIDFEARGPRMPPAISVLKTRAEVAAMISKDHELESQKCRKNRAVRHLE